MSALHDVATVTGIVVISYFTALNGIYLAFTAVAWRSITAHLRGRAYSGADEAFASPLTPGVSVLLPAYNEEAGIVESVRSLLGLRYPSHEVIVVNDGSTDATLSRLREEFELVGVRKALRDSLPCAAVRGTYVSVRHPGLVVIDKENGGKADALNAGVRAARHPYVCAVDADAMLEPDALLHVAKPLLDDPELVVATGGIVRIANGCRVEHGRVTEVGLPRSRLATLQVVEYFRAFLVGRVGWSRLRSLLIISGAFGLFRRSAVEAVGGWWTGTVGEDVELVVRLHRHLRERGEDYRIEFVPDPVCWTEAPEDLRTLARQRRRWQRGLAEALWRHRRMAANPRFGAVGLLAFPYFLVFELLGPLIELLGYVMVPVAVASGTLSPSFLVCFLAVSVLLGLLLSVSALALEEFSFRRHARGREVGRMLAFALVDNFGYRQLIGLFRGLAFIDLARRRRSWGEQRRRGFGPAAASASGRDPGRRVAPAPAQSNGNVDGRLPGHAVSRGARSAEGH
ncbi:MAG: glycosyltransferase family 2 protein [Actinomycetota bacterium]|nr:glycosyltransferase family 2 protein [Actinomycetota bacterium]